MLPPHPPPKCLQLLYSPVSGQGAKLPLAARSILSCNELMALLIIYPTLAVERRPSLDWTEAKVAHV